MTERELKVTKAILEVLHEEDGRQVSEISLHGGVTALCTVGVTEFNAAIALCDKHRWITVYQPRLTTVRKINITDAGEARLLEIRNE